MGRKSRKNVAIKPPLSAIDKLIYASLYIICAVLCIVIMVLFIGILPEKIAFSADNVYASNFRGAILAVPFILVPFAALVPIATLQNRKQPFFGNKKFKSSRPVIKTYPIFSSEWKNRPKSSEKERRARVKIAAICIAILIAAVAVAILGLPMRHVIMSDDTVACYNSLNTETDSYYIKDADSVEISAYKYRSGGKTASRVHYSIEVVISVSDKEFTFPIGYFESSEEGVTDYELALGYMLHLKDIIPENKLTLNGEYLSEAIEDRALSATETALAKKLFE